MLSLSSAISSPSKGNWPVKIWKSKVPRLQMSALYVYGRPWITSGAIYKGVPHIVAFISFRVLKFFARPRSPNLNSKSLMGRSFKSTLSDCFLVFTRIFSSFMSLCITLHCQFKCVKPDTMSLMTYYASASLNICLSPALILINLSRSP